jgi:hypothetical protein
MEKHYRPVTQTRIEDPFIIAMVNAARIPRELTEEEKAYIQAQDDLFKDFPKIVL